MTDEQMAALRWALSAHQLCVASLNSAHPKGREWEALALSRDEALKRAGLPTMEELDGAVSRRVKELTNA